MQSVQNLAAGCLKAKHNLQPSSLVSLGEEESGAFQLARWKMHHLLPVHLEQWLCAKLHQASDV